MSIGSLFEYDIYPRFLTVDLFVSLTDGTVLTQNRGKFGELVNRDHHPLEVEAHLQLPLLEAALSRRSLPFISLVTKKDRYANPVTWISYLEITNVPG